MGHYFREDLEGLTELLLAYAKGEEGLSKLENFVNDWSLTKPVRTEIYETAVLLRKIYDALE